MFGVPLLVTGMFYFMFGNLAKNGGFDLPKTKVVVADLDEGGPKFRFRPKDIPNARYAKTMGDLIVNFAPTGMIPTKEMTPRTSPRIPRRRRSGAGRTARRSSS